MRLPGEYSDKLTVGLLISPAACSETLNTDCDYIMYSAFHWIAFFFNFLRKFSILELLKHTTVAPNKDNIIIQRFDSI